MASTKPAILCTGPVDDAAVSVPYFASVDIDVVPFTSISTELSSTTIQQINDSLGQRKVVVFTSSNAVRAVGDLIKQKLPDWTIFCIGNTTFRLAKEYFGEANIKDTAARASDLAEKIIRHKEITEVTFFCGNLRRSELPDALIDRGITVSEIVVYHTSLVPRRLDRQYDAIIFFSPSAAESFFRENTVLPHTSMFVMGKTTADSIKNHSENPIITGHEPDKNALVREAVDFVLSRRTELNKG